ncbi:MAG: PilN domain-containing protein [Clostridiales bacterium]|nr:PilN domain-containing protein [Clostridiales bacterium]
MDFNFFESYKKPKASSRTSKYALAIFAGIVLLALGGLSFYTNERNADLESQIAMANDEINSKTYEDARNELDEKERANASARTTVGYFKALVAASRYAQTADPTYMDYIVDTAPADVVVTNYSISKMSVQLSGKSRERMSIVDYQSALRSLGAFNDINLQSITQVGGTVADIPPTFSFSMTMNINSEKLYETALAETGVVDEQALAQAKQPETIIQ